MFWGRSPAVKNLRARACVRRARVYGPGRVERKRAVKRLGEHLIDTGETASNGVIPQLVSSRKQRADGVSDGVDRWKGRESPSEWYFVWRGPRVLPGELRGLFEAERCFGERRGKRKVGAECRRESSGCHISRGLSERALDISAFSSCVGVTREVVGFKLGRQLGFGNSQGKIENAKRNIGAFRIVMVLRQIPVVRKGALSNLSASGMRKASAQLFARLGLLFVEE